MREDEGLDDEGRDGGGLVEERGVVADEEDEVLDVLGGVWAVEREGDGVGAEVAEVGGWVAEAEAREAGDEVLTLLIGAEVLEEVDRLVHARRQLRADGGRVQDQGVDPGQEAGGEMGVVLRLDGLGLRRGRFR